MVCRQTVWCWCCQREAGISHRSHDLESKVRAKKVTKQFQKDSPFLNLALSRAFQWFQVRWLVIWSNSKKASAHSVAPADLSWDRRRERFPLSAVGGVGSVGSPSTRSSKQSVALLLDFGRDKRRESVRSFIAYHLSKRFGLLLLFLYKSWCFHHRLLRLNTTPTLNPEPSFCRIPQVGHIINVFVHEHTWSAKSNFEFFLSWADAMANISNSMKLKGFM